MPVRFLFLTLLHSSFSAYLFCTHQIFCQGELLHTVQTSGIFADSKTFVDMSIKDSTTTTLKHFETLMIKTKRKPSKSQILKFVEENFEATHQELETWEPPDYNPNPPILREIQNADLRTFALKTNSLWPLLGRKVRPEVQKSPEKYSIIPVSKGFIIPGGRFREIYYWDSYWIIKGLLICSMNTTVKGMLINFFEIVNKYGFVPNGNRIYYLDRSHPPLLTIMVGAYVEATQDWAFIKLNIESLEQELQFWLKRRTITVRKNGRSYTLARYISAIDKPRPESYREDLQTASFYQNEEARRLCYNRLRTCAESGWDFSTRWMFNPAGGNGADLKTVNPLRILPVDLNSYLYKDFALLSNFYAKINNPRSKFWKLKAEEWQEAIEDLLYHPEDGIWYDYDTELNRPRRYFYASNFAPLWAGAYNLSLSDTRGGYATRYFKNQGVTDYQGGVPTSLVESGQQWDMPNAWPPLQNIVILGLDASGNVEAQKVAEQFAKGWIGNLVQSKGKTKQFFEKYSAIIKGAYGGGGEYIVQTGFGWTNGGILELIEHYYVKKKVPLN